MLCVLGTVIFLLEGSIKRSTANLQIPGRRKCIQRDKNGNANNVEFYAILAHPSHMQFLLKTQKSQTQLKISYPKHNVSYRLPYIHDFSICNVTQSSKIISMKILKTLRTQCMLCTIVRHKDMVIRTTL